MSIMFGFHQSLMCDNISMYVCGYVDEYVCSICGCTNHLSQEIDSLGNQFVNQQYVIDCGQGDRYRSIRGNERVYVFGVGLYGMEKEEGCDNINDGNVGFVQAGVQVIRNWLQQHQQQQKQKQQGNVNIKVIIFGFDEQNIYEYYHIDNNNNITLMKQVNTHLTIDAPTLIENRHKYMFDLRQHKNIIIQILDDLLTHTHTHHETLSPNSPKITKQQQYPNPTLLCTLQMLLLICQSIPGRLFLFTPLSHPPPSFLSSILQQPQQFQSNNQLHIRKCLPQSLTILLKHTHINISIYILADTFVNVTPLYAICKMTNGEMKEYDFEDRSGVEMFYYQFWNCVQEDVGVEGVLKVRASGGVKLVSVFGSYRQSMTNNNTNTNTKNTNKSKQQIQLMTCPQSRQYTFQFFIQGNILPSHLAIQFSISWTNHSNHRIFRILTYSQQMSSSIIQIIHNINYTNVCTVYLSAMIHNMQLNVKMKKLQLTLQQRCTHHIKMLHKLNQKYIKNAKTYIMFTFYLMRHYIMNTPFGQTCLYDRSIQIRSRILNDPIKSMQYIWPTVYKINRQNVEIVELMYRDVRDTEIGVVADQGSCCYVYLTPSQTAKRVKLKYNQRVNTDTHNNTIDSNITLLECIKQQPQLSKIVQTITTIMQQRACRYIQVKLLESVSHLCVLDEKGGMGYDSFINHLLK